MAVWIVAPARAGTLDIVSCGAAAPSNADTAWTYASDDAGGYEVGPTVCPPNGTQFGGLVAWTKLNSGTTPAAPAGADLRFVAPAGTRISRVRLTRDIGTRNDGYYVFGRTDSGQLPGETCVIPVSQFTCDVGGPSAPEADFTGLDAAWVSWGFQCGANGFVNCGTGSTLHQAWAVIYASTVTLVDNQPPSIPTVVGSLTDPGWKRGAVSATATATDNLGIRSVRWYADGNPIPGSAVTRTCDFSTRVPCSDISTEALSLDTTALADGSHAVELAAVDPAGNERRSTPTSVDVDNTPPAAPTGLVASGGGTSPSFTLSWTNPPDDGGSPLASATWRACPTMGGGGCTTGSGTLTTGGGSASGTLPAAGGYELSVWLTDAAGNGTAANAAQATIAYAPPSGGGGGSGGGGTGGSTTTPARPSEPTPPAILLPPGAVTPSGPASPGGSAGRATASLAITRARLAADRRSATIRGTITATADGIVALTVRARVAGGTRSRAASARIDGGRFAATVALPRSWREARRVTAIARYDGSVSVGAAKARARVTRRSARR